MTEPQASPAVSDLEKRRAEMLLALRGAVHVLDERIKGEDNFNKRRRLVIERNELAKKARRLLVTPGQLVADHKGEKGSVYEVQRDGSYRRLNKKPSKKDRRRAHA